MLYLSIPVLALLLGITAALYSTSSPSGSSQPSSSTPETASTTPSAHLEIDLPELDLEPLDPDPAWWLNSQAPGSIGVVWITREGADPSSLLKNDTQRQLYEDLRACFPEDASNEELFLGKTGCFDEKAIRAAASLPDPTNVFSAIRALNTARPDVFTVCHNASHKVGEIALRRVVKEYGMDKKIIAALLDRGANACMGGLMHGTLDAVGLLAESIDEFAPAVEACLLANPSNLGYCTDAIGHATWDAFADTTSAAEVCSFFKDSQSRRECGEGILMRIYQRKETTDTWYEGTVKDSKDLPRWNAEIIEICKSWPATPFPTAPEDPREWCWSGSTYLFLKPVFQVLESKGGQIQPVFDELADRFKQTLESCAKFPAPGDTLCMERLGPSVGHLAAFEEEYARKLCALYPDEALAASCTKQALQRIESAYAE